MSRMTVHEAESGKLVADLEGCGISNGENRRRALEYAQYQANERNVRMEVCGLGDTVVIDPDFVPEPPRPRNWARHQVSQLIRGGAR